MTCGSDGRPAGAARAASRGDGKRWSGHSPRTAHAPTGRKSRSSSRRYQHGVVVGGRHDGVMLAVLHLYLLCGRHPRPGAGPTRPRLERVGDVGVAVLVAVDLVRVEPPIEAGL